MLQDLDSSWSHLLLVLPTIGGVGTGVKRGACLELLSGSDNMLDLLEKQKIEILRVIFIDLKKDTKCDLL